MIYLDNCATTRLRKEVLEKMYKSLDEDFGNPSSLHNLGLDSERKIKQARNIISDFLQVKASEIYFSSGGTESNNIAIQSIIDKYSNRGKHIVTTNIEHASILNTIKHYQEKGFRVTYLKVDKYGLIDLEELRDSICKETILVSIIHVNNEIGSIQNIKAIKNIIRERSDALFHLDGIQSFGKIPISLRELDIDTFSFSGHKIHGPKGIGGLYIRDRLNLNPIVYGGNQELGIRSGTENLTGIIGMGEAVRIIQNNQRQSFEYIKGLKSYMIRSLVENISDIRINSPFDERFSPYILNISIKNIRGEILLHYLEQKEIYISTTSACSSKGTEKSHVLKAIALEDEDIEGAIRVCFSYDISKEDIDYVVGAMKTSVEEIRNIIMR